MNKKKNNGWVSVKDSLPETGKKVLVYYEIMPSKKTDNNGKPYQYRKIAYVESITIGKDYKHVNWQDEKYEAMDPLFWHPLPEYPNMELTKAKPLGKNCPNYITEGCKTVCEGCKIQKK